MRAVGVAAMVLAAGLPGCTTLTRGTRDELYVLSDPPGAKATASFGPTCITPCKFDVNRQDKLSVEIKKPGYDTQNVEVKVQSTAPDSATSREVTVDYLGRVVDFQDGAHLIHVPNPVSVKLNKTAASPAG